MCLVKACLGVVAFALLVVSVPSEAGAQCVSTANRVNQSTPGTLSIQGSTTQQNCTGRTTWVQASIDGRIYECSEDLSSTAECIKTSESSNAVVTAYDDGCGTWVGRTYHKFLQGGQTTNLASGMENLNGGNCEEEGGGAENCPPTWIFYDGVCVQGSPIVIATKSNARYKLTSAEQGVLFDIDGDGMLEQIGWTEHNSDVAFLAVDRDGDGQITSGRELFGNYTLAGAPNGFAALQRMAMRTNGGIERASVSEDDPLFFRLLLWTDSNHNGISERRELRPARELLSDIGLGYEVSTRADRHGNVFKYKGWANIRTAHGRNRAGTPREDVERRLAIYDVYFSSIQ